MLTAVQEYADLLNIAGRPLQDAQIQDLAYYLINKYQIYQDALKNWNKLPLPKTWEMMKEHMRQEYQTLKDVNALTIDESALNSTDIVQELKLHKEHLLNNAEQRFKTELTEVMNLAITDFELKNKSTESKTEEAINNTAEINALKLEIKKLQSKLQNNNSSYQNNSFNNFNGQNRNRYNNRWNNQRNNNRNFNRQFYCWTHGAGHSGWQCKNPADGHQPEATFTNRMGGNNYGCYPTQPRRFQSNNQSRPRFNDNEPTKPQHNQN